MLGALPTSSPAQSTAWVLAACVSLAGQAAHGFTPTRQEACCQAVVQGLADAAPCGAERPSVEVCTEVLAAMSRAAEAQARARAQTQTQGPDERSPTEVRPRSPSGAGRSIAVLLVSVLAALAVWRVGIRRVARPVLGLGVFVATQALAAWGLTTLACVPLRCVDTMGLGVLLVSLLPAGVLAAWVTRRVLGRRPTAVHRPGERTEP